MQGLKRFAYEALNKQAQRVNGVILAADEHDALRRVQRQGLEVLSLLGEQRRQSGAERRRKLRREELQQALHELATLLERGVALAEALGALIDSGHHPVLCDGFEAVLLRLRGGASLSEALAQSPLELPAFFLQLVQAGELSGELAEAVRSGVAQMAYQQKVRQEMRNALIYPSLLVSSGFLVLIIIFTVVVPRFQAIAERAQGELPLLSRLILAVGAWFNEHILLVFVGIGLLALLGVRLVTSATGRQRLLLVGLKVPVIGEWLREVDAHTWASALAALLGSRVSLLTALEFARNTVFSPVFQARLAVVGDAVKKGVPLSGALREHDALEASACALIAVGERSGEVPSMLRSLSEMYEENSKQRMARVLALIEPAAIIVIGVFVGLIILGVIQTIMGVTNVQI